MLTPWKKSYDQPRQHIKKQRHYFVNKGPSSQSYGFSSSHVWMWDLDYKESWAPKNWCFWTVVLEKTLESPLDCKEIQPVNPKGNQSWIFIGSTDAKAETLILWPPDVKNWLIWKGPDAGKDWRREEKGNNRGWDGWMASLMQWTWVWVNSGNWWWTGKPGVLQSMWLQRVGHDWATELSSSHGSSTVPWSLSSCSYWKSTLFLFHIKPIELPPLPSSSAADLISLLHPWEKDSPPLNCMGLGCMGRVICRLFSI